MSFEPVVNADAWDEFSLPAIEELNRELARANRYREAIAIEWRIVSDEAYDRVIQRWWDVRDEAESLILGTSRELGHLDARWDEFIHALGILALSNDCWGDVFEAQVAVHKAMQSSGITRLGSQKSKATIEGFDRRLKSLKKDLEDAKAALPAVITTAAIDFVLSWVGFALGFTEISLAASAAITFGSQAVNEVSKMIAEGFTGSKLPESSDKFKPIESDTLDNELSTVIDAIADAAEAADDIRKTDATKWTKESVKALGIAKSYFDSLLTTVNSVLEIGHILGIIERVKKSIAEVERDLPEVMRIVNGITIGETKNLAAAAELLRSRLGMAISGRISLAAETDRLTVRFREPSAWINSHRTWSLTIPSGQQHTLGCESNNPSLPAGERSVRTQRHLVPRFRKGGK